MSDTPCTCWSEGNSKLSYLPEDDVMVPVTIIECEACGSLLIQYDDA